jgi:glycosyltransferase involved in cell wall biosynthesis
MEVSFIFRKRRSNAYSIESLFDNIYRSINTRNQFQAYKVEVPTVRNVATNIVHAAKAQATVSHITGDIHYVALGLKKRNTVLTIHDCVFLTRFSKRSLKYWLFKFLWYQLPMWRSGTITVISEKTKRELVRLTGVDPNRVKVVPNFYDPRFTFQPKEFNSAKPRILQIGTKENKNIVRLAQALNGIRCELHIVGEPDAAAFAALHENNIEFYTYNNLSFEELQAQYVAADMVAFVSTYEGFGLPILEACAVGRPLVTSNIAPLKDIAGDAACKVNPYSVLDIRRGICRIIEDAAYRDALINKGWQLRYKYSIDNITSQYSEIYNEIASRPAPEYGFLRPLRAAASLMGLA